VNEKRTKTRLVKPTALGWPVPSEEIHMSQPAQRSPETDQAAILEEEVEEAIALCGGDARAALKSALVASAFLQAQVETLAAAASTGFVRGRIRSAKNSRDANSEHGHQHQQAEGLPQPDAAPVGRGE
jgi:hypothetical protein